MGNDKLLIYAIGDIHGRLDLLSQLIDLIKNDRSKRKIKTASLVLLGDYVDRGKESKQVIDYILSLKQDDFDVHCIKGNHEQLLLNFYHDSSDAEIWFNNGGKDTLQSYGVNVEQDLPHIHDDFIERLPNKHLKFFQSLSTPKVIGDYCFVHAGIRPEVPLEEQEEHDLLWIRDEFLTSSTLHEKIVIHGHSITSEPDVQTNRIGIDTGAFYTNKLTCLVLGGRKPRFLQTTA